VYSLSDYFNRTWKDGCVMSNVSYVTCFEGQARTDVTVSDYNLVMWKTFQPLLLLNSP
jgi:hypothetical protein